MIKFSPRWDTDPILDDATEGDAVNIALAATNFATAMVPAGQAQLDLGLDASSVTQVHFNGDDRGFSGGANVLFFTALATDTVLEIWASTPITYSVISGKLPKGVSMTPLGIISGVPNSIKDPAGENYTFTVRATNGRLVKDRTFSLIVYPIPQVASWNLAGLPLPVLDATASTAAYHPLGDVRRGDAFAFTIDVSHPDGEEVSISIDNITTIIPAANHFNGKLPEGLAVLGNSIEGVVLPSTPPGKYFFNLAALGSNNFVPCMIEVMTSRVSTFKRPVKMQWITSEGLLGSLMETDVCTLSVAARDPNGGNVIYSLLPGTGDLPPGLVLNSQTGDVEGQVSYVDADTVYEFKVRASSGTIFADRTFSIEVRDFYNVVNVATVKLKFQGRAKRDLMKGYEALIPADWIYRADDPFFGIVDEPFIHIARGIFPDATLSNLDYRNNIASRLGPHKIAYARNEAGEVIYEVLYRQIIDPMDEDPFGTDYRPYGLTIDYRHAKEALQIHPMSIWNMRYDLIADYGNGYDDIMPLWMSSIQDTAPLGFITAVAVAYLKPGNGKGMLDLIAADTTLPRDGYSVPFDRVLVSRIGAARLRFDVDQPRYIPFYVAANQNSITTARWTGLVSEAFALRLTTITEVVDGPSITVPDGDLSAIDMSRVDLNAEYGVMTIPTEPFARMIYLLVVGQPQTEPRANNAPIGTNLVLGPFVAGMTKLVIDNVELPPAQYVRKPDQGIVQKTSNFVAGTEIRIEMSETTFDADNIDGETKFDNRTTEIGKYIKLADDFKKPI